MPIMPICKTFADDTLLFTKIIDTRNPEDVPTCDLKLDLKRENAI